MRLVRQLPWSVAIILCLTLGLAPFAPQPHLVEKLGMLLDGTLTRPLDMLDLILHAMPFVLLLLKLSLFRGKNRAQPD